jgi:hypothetical protein
LCPLSWGKKMITNISRNEKCKALSTYKKIEIKKIKNKK